MNVYVLVEWWSYEGSYVRGVFTTMAEAEAARDTLPIGNNVDHGYDIETCEMGEITP